MLTLNSETKIKTLLNRNPDLSLNFVPLIIKDKRDCISMIVNFKGLKLLNWLISSLNQKLKLKISITS